MIRNDAEFKLQCAVIQCLKLRAPRNVFWFSPPNGDRRSVKAGNRLKAMGMVAGVSDIVLVINGRAHGLELKVAGGRQSAAQRVVEEAWRAAGGVYAVTTGIDETLAMLVRWGALPPEFANRPKPMPLPFEEIIRG